MPFDPADLARLRAHYADNRGGDIHDPHFTLFVPDGPSPARGVESTF